MNYLSWKFFMIQKVLVSYGRLNPPLTPNPKYFNVNLWHLLLLYMKKKKEVFANGINSGILRWRDYPRLSGWVLNAIKHLLLRGSKGKFYIQEQRRNGIRMGRGEMWSYWLEAWSNAATCQGMQQPSETRTDKAAWESEILITPSFYPNDRDFGVLASRTMWK